jgi:hypothetical protein
MNTVMGGKFATVLAGSETVTMALWLKEVKRKLIGWSP